MKKILSILALSILANFAFAEIEFHTDFPGANGTLQKIEANEIWFKHDLRDTDGWWFYWSFELSGVAGKEIKVNFMGGDAIGNLGPAYSFDGGKTWQWLGRNSFVKASKKGEPKYTSFTHKIPESVDSVRYCLSYPYQLADFNAFAEKFKGNAEFKIEPLAKTLKGRENFCARFGDKNAKHKLVLIARQHCCEAAASYALEGLVDEAMSNSEVGKALRADAEFFVVPFVDLDGVEDGDQGKNRKPRDHNRDWADNPRYPTVKAIMAECKSYPADAKIIAIDFHCPGMRERKSYFYYVSIERVTKNIERLAEILQKNAATAEKSLPYFKKDDARFGAIKNNSEVKPTSKDWITALPNSEIGTTFEFPYSEAKGVPVTGESARNFGKVFAKSLADYISTDAAGKAE